MIRVGKMSRRHLLAVAAPLALAACLGGGAPVPAGPGPVASSGGSIGVAPASPRVAAVVAAVNDRRVANGLGPLIGHVALDRAAQRHAADMAASGRLGHTGSDGSSMEDRVLGAGYDYRSLGENVAAGQASAAAVVADWMDSPGHRANILMAEAREIGVGYAEGIAVGNVPGRFWVLVVGAR